MEEVYLIWAMHIEYQKAYFAPYCCTLFLKRCFPLIIVRLGGSAMLYLSPALYNSSLGLRRSLDLSKNLSAARELGQSPLSSMIPVKVAAEILLASSF